MRGRVVALLLAPLLTWSPAGWAGEETTAVTATTPDHETSSTPDRIPRPHTRPVPGRGIDETVRLLTRGLNLNATQQVKLREILWDEQKQARNLRRNPGPGVDWVSATATLVDQTRTRIRALLDDDQRQKYAADVPHALTAPAQADLQHWIALQDSKRLQADGATK